MYKEQYNLINDVIKNFSINDINGISDIKIENLRQFLIPLFEAYEKGKIDYINFTNVAEALKLYLIVKYGNYYPKTNYPEFPNTDYRSLAITAVEYMNDIGEFFMFPEDIPYFISFLKTQPGKEVEAHEQIEKYTSQFKYIDRLNDAKKRGYTT